MAHTLLCIPLALTAVAAAVDLRRREIPDALPVALAVWGVTAAACRWVPLGWATVTGGGAAGAAVGLALYVGGGFGGGDAKLLAALGLSLGVAGLAWTALYMALAGGVLALIAAARGRRTLAYGPAVAVGLGVYVAQQVTA